MLVTEEEVIDDGSENATQAEDEEDGTIYVDMTAETTEAASHEAEAEEEGRNSAYKNVCVKLLLKKLRPFLACLILILA